METRVPARAAVALGVAALIAAAGALPISALAAFYLAALALAGMVGVAFAAYLELVDRPCLACWAEAGAAALAVGLLACDCALRFPDVLMPGAPPASGALTGAAAAAALAAALVRLVPAPALARPALRALPEPLRALLSR